MMGMGGPIKVYGASYPDGAGLDVGRPFSFDMSFESPFSVDDQASISNAVGFGVHGEGDDTSYRNVRANPNEAVHYYTIV
jgi:hypothetical protein